MIGVENLRAKRGVKEGKRRKDEKQGSVLVHAYVRVSGAARSELKSLTRCE